MKMIGVEMGFWVYSWLSCLKLIRELRGTVELGLAQGELKSGSSSGRRLSCGLVVAHGGACNFQGLVELGFPPHAQFSCGSAKGALAGAEAGPRELMAG